MHDLRGRTLAGTFCHAPVRGSKIIGVARNYPGYARSSGKQSGRVPAGFIKVPSCIVGPGRDATPSATLNQSGTDTAIDLDGDQPVVSWRDEEGASGTISCSLVVGADGRLLRRIRRDSYGREIIIIDNSYRDPRAVGGFYVDLPPPVVRIPYDRYIVAADEAPPEVIYETMVAPPVQRIDRRYSLDEIRYSPNVRMQMPSIDVNTINFATGSWEIPPDQAAKLQVIADGLNRAIQANPRAVFLIEGHTDKVGSDVDNLSLSDRRAEAAATLLTQQFGVPAENLTSQGYGEQYPKEQTDGPSVINRRVTIRNITPLLNGGQASLPPPPPGTAPPR